ncbi:MAG: peptide chain release factor 1 [Spirochaetales bacterium]|nr:peptide chain release factor 1 [Leptospiraceae bacterium]MCP5482167.1 peptide chain release factor 1 [Spirochaetales bacterium]MCP5484721.1 peptide chain release factor 1 [Spirochaetales bacterium]
MQARTLIERLEREIESFEEVESLLASSEIADNPNRLKELSRQHATLSPRIRQIREFIKLSREAEEARSLVETESDSEVREMAEAELEQLESVLQSRRKQIEYLLIPPDPNSGRGILMEIRAGTGGEEAGLFVADLLRMYMRFAEKRGLKAELLSAQETEIGGYKEVVVSVQGSEAYDLLHREGGAHRVQRIPATESGGRIHTSAVTVAVMPEVEETEIEIDDKDLEIDVYRASGAGGQHVNKTESAIRITHIPSGLVVTCQDERSQHKNKAKAMRVLRARLSEQEDRARAASDAARKKEQVKSGDRSERIRTYNFPQGRVTDHRIGFTAYNLDHFMEGEMDELLEALLAAEREEKLKAIEPARA